MLGYYDERKLIHAGRVGTGFSNKVAADLFQRLEEMRIPNPAWNASQNFALAAFAFSDMLALGEPLRPSNKKPLIGLSKRSATAIIPLITRILNNHTKFASSL